MFSSALHTTLAPSFMRIWTKIASKVNMIRCGISNSLNLSVFVIMFDQDANCLICPPRYPLFFKTKLKFHLSISRLLDTCGGYFTQKGWLEDATLCDEERSLDVLAHRPHLIWTLSHKST